jgi:hypothetical protein
LEVTVKRKIVACVLVASLSFFIGCYSTQSITKEELKATVERDINLITKDSLEYRFFGGDYSIQGDTLSGTGVQIINGWATDQHFHGSMSMTGIAKLTAEEFSLAGTIAAVAVSAGVVGGCLLLLFGSPK